MNFDSNVLQVAIEDIIPNRFQPRLAFEDNSLQELAESIKQHGIIQPLVLRRIGEKYEIIAGERRYKAAQMAGLATVPAVISQIDDQTSAEVAVVENVQRKDLSAIEEAKSYKALLDQGFMSQDQLAKKMGLSQSAISNKLRLLTLPTQIQEAVMENKISERHARTLLSLRDAEEQLVWLDKIISERLTVRQLTEAIRKEYPTAASVQAVDINSVKQNAMDIKTMDIATPAQESTPNSFQMGAIDLGERTQNKFFNTLEDEAANMQMTEAINPFQQSGFTSDNSLASGTTINEAVNFDSNQVIELSKEEDKVLGGAIKPEDMPVLKAPEEKEESSGEESTGSSFGPPPVATTPSADTPIFEMTSPTPPSIDAIKEDVSKGNSPFEISSPVQADIPVGLAPTFEPTPVSDPVVETSTSEPKEADSLDVLDFEPPKDSKKSTEASEKVQDLINELKIYGYPLDAVKTDLVDQITYTITIKKED